MPHYSFLCTSEACGHVTEVFAPMSAIPESAECEVCHQRAERSLVHDGGGIVGTGKIANDKKYPYVSNRLPRGMKSCGVKCNAQGKPIVENARQERNIASKLHMDRE